MSSRPAMTQAGRLCEGQPSAPNLLTLPVEIRLQIWDLLNVGNRTFCPLKGRQLSLPDIRAVNPVEDRQLSLADDVAQLFLLCRTVYQDVFQIFYCKGVFNLRDEHHFDFITKVPVEACQMMKHIGLRLVDFENFGKFARGIIWRQLESITILPPEQIYFSYHPPQSAWRKEEKSRTKLSLLMLQEVVKSPQFPKIIRAVESEDGWKGIADTIPLPDETTVIDLDQDNAFLEELKDLLAVDIEIGDVITPIDDEISSLQARIDQLEDQRNKLYHPLKHKRRRKTLTMAKRFPWFGRVNRSGWRPRTAYAMVNTA